MLKVLPMPLLNLCPTKGACPMFPCILEIRKPMQILPQTSSAARWHLVPALLWEWHAEHPPISINDPELISQPGTELMAVNLASSFLNSFIAFKKIFVKYKYKGRRFTYKVKTQISNINTQFRKFSLCTVSSNFNIC